MDSRVPASSYISTIAKGRGKLSFCQQYLSIYNYTQPHNYTTMLGTSINSARSQPALSMASTMSHTGGNPAGITPKAFPQGGHSTPLIATSDDMTKCKYVAKSSQLGDGNFSVVKECINVQTHGTYAMKLVHKNLVRDKLQLIKREFNLLQTLSVEIRHIEEESGNKPQLDYFQGHHHVLQLYDYFETHENIVLITQLCDKDDLYEHITSKGHLDLQRQVAPYTACLVSVLQFLHSQGIIHRDIKAENVLFRRNKRKPRLGTEALPEEYDLAAHDLILGDFGLAAKTHEGIGGNSNTLREYVGTISYIAPEIVRCKNVASMVSTEEVEKLKPYGAGVDVWALGVLVYFMAFGYTPFDCETDDETLDCIKQCDYYIDDEAMQDPAYADLWNFLQCCYVVDDSKRDTAKQLRDHPFVSRYFDTADSGSAQLLGQRPSTMHRNRSFNTLRKMPSVSSDEDEEMDSTPGNSLTTPLTHYSYGSGASVQDNTHDTSFVNLTPQEQDANGHHQLTKTKSHGTDTPAPTGEKRHGLRRTISMTTVKTSPSSYRVNKSNNASIIASHSTFFLDPAPPQTSLMHGTFSEAPQQLSNFNTTPKSMSRNSSSKSLFSLINGSSDKNSGGAKHSEHWRNNNAETDPVTFDLGSSDDEEYEN